MQRDAILIANRGEIALRVLRAARELGLRVVAVFSEEDARAPHVLRADLARSLGGRGPAAYLDRARLVELALETGATLLHPGYGFASEDPELARLCAAAGVRFVGPDPEHLALFGDKVVARDRARERGIPVLPGTGSPVDAEGARRLLHELGPGAAIAVKAVHGGGGRGLRVVRRPEEVEEALARCASEARTAFGRGELFAEAWLPRVRHLEVQVAGDGSGEVVHLFERDCSLQRRNQKRVEVAPAPGLSEPLRRELLDHAVALFRGVGFRGLATAEFLLEVEGSARPGRLHFLEVNPRLQVEHPVTEEVLGIDLVAAQIELARGRDLAAAGLAPEAIPSPRGHAIEVRLCAEELGGDGRPLPASGVVGALGLPGGPGVRVETALQPGCEVGTSFDPLLAKIVAHAGAGSFEAARRRVLRALRETEVEGVPTNRAWLVALLERPEVARYEVSTAFVEEHAAELGLAAAERGRPADTGPVSSGAGDPEGTRGRRAYRAPIRGTVVAVEVEPGDPVRAGQTLLVVESMKMEYPVVAAAPGRIAALPAAAGAAVSEGQLLAVVEPTAEDLEPPPEAEVRAPGALRPELEELRSRRARALDEARPEAVARRRRTGQRTARENLADLLDPGSFVEYGPLVIAAQRRRRSLEELIERTPADGLVGGLGTVNRELFPDGDTRCIALSYDYTVLAGTQGQQNHRKKDRLFELARQYRLPVVLFAEGGGGRPGDTDALGVSGLDCMAFRLFGELSGLVPLVGIAAGRCFAGNAALLGCCDVVIAVRGCNIGMGGPAMIEGGGLGSHRPEEIGPFEVQLRNGVVDLPAEDEAEAVRLARQYLGYFQGRLCDFEAPDPLALREVVPENRRRVYDVRGAIEGVADRGTVLELRPGFAPGMVTALARIEGRPIGLVANNPMHLAGAIDAPGADKAARFLGLCDAFDLPVLFLCDTPGILVGPEAEQTALVRHAARLFTVGASLRVPVITVVLRKGYGLGAQAMAAGSFKAPLLTVSWPTGEFGGMGLEGAVRLGFRRELEAEPDPEAREALFREMVDRLYEHGRAIHTASYFEIDDVIDPADTRRVITRALESVPPSPPRSGKRRPCVDPW